MSEEAPSSRCARCGKPVAELTNRSLKFESGSGRLCRECMRTTRPIWQERPSGRFIPNEPYPGYNAYKAAVEAVQQPLREQQAYIAARREQDAALQAMYPQGGHWTSSEALTVKLVPVGSAEQQQAPATPIPRVRQTGKKAFQTPEEFAKSLNDALNDLKPKHSADRVVEWFIEHDPTFASCTASQIRTWCRKKLGMSFDDFKKSRPI